MQPVIATLFANRCNPLLGQVGPVKPMMQIYWKPYCPQTKVEMQPVIAALFANRCNPLLGQVKPVEPTMRIY